MSVQAFLPAAPIRSNLHPARRPRSIHPKTIPCARIAPSNPKARPSIRHAIAAALAALSIHIVPVRAHPTQNQPVSASNIHPHVARASPTNIPLSVRPVARPSPSNSAGHGLQGQSFTVAASAALLASAAAVSVTHPIDTLKTIRQARDQGLPATPEVSLPVLYKGVLSNILKEAPNAAIYLGTYELFKDALLTMSMFSAHPLLAMCVAGMLGDAVGSIVRVPAEIINKRLQLGLSANWGSAVKDSFLSPNGVEGTFASWAAVLWRDVPYGGLQIAGYEFVRLTLSGFGYSGLLFNVVAGAVAGLFAAVLTTPADVLVTRMSTQRPQCYLETKSYMSPSATFFRIIKEEGVGALWSGAMHRGLFYMPMIGLFFAAYESFKHLIVNPGTVLSAFAGSTVVLGPIAPFFRALVMIAASVKLPLHLAVVAISQCCWWLFSRRTAAAPRSVRH